MLENALGRIKQGLSLFEACSLLRAQGLSEIAIGYCLGAHGWGVDDDGRLARIEPDDDPVLLTQGVSGRTWFGRL